MPRMSGLSRVRLHNPNCVRCPHCPNKWCRNQSGLTQHINSAHILPSFRRPTVGHNDEHLPEGRSRSPSLQPNSEAEIPGALDSTIFVLSLTNSNAVSAHGNGEDFVAGKVYREEHPRINGVSCRSSNICYY